MYNRELNTVYTITIINLALTVPAYLLKLIIIGLAIQITVAVLIFRGVHWGRIPVAISALFNIIVGLFYMIASSGLGIMSVIIAGYYLLFIAYFVVTATILCISKGVNEYFRLSQILYEVVL